MTGIRTWHVPTGLTAHGRDLSLEVTARYDLSWSVRWADAGIAEIRIVPAETTVIRAAWRVPCTDSTAYWTPDSNEHRGLPPFWRRPRAAALERGAPVGSLIGSGDMAVCTFAVGEAVNPVLTRAGVVEETGDFGFWVEHAADPGTGLSLLLDLSGRHFADTLAGVTAWWGERYPAEPAPREGRMPVYSTWYTMQQHVTAETVERQAGLSAELGCEVIIVDDGWHSDDRGRGYGHVGEWEPSRTAFPDMAGHVAKVRDTGLAYMLWYALPLVGRHTALWDRVKPYTLTFKEHMNAAVADPRYPFIRDLVIDRLGRAVTEWGMDGLKIDFIDQFAVEDPPAPGPEADCATVTEGVDRLMAGLNERLVLGGRRPLVESRQPYVSPALWRHATMIRASDCPLSPAHNRQRTVDLRLIAGPLAVHADMMMWHPRERPEQVAAQLVNVLFAVPQISVDLTEQTPEQMEVLRFWLGFVKEHARVLQGGRFTPFRPDLVYPLVTAEGEGVVIAGRYAPVPVPVATEGRLLVANADASTEVVLAVGAGRTATVAVVDCRGRKVSEPAVVELTPGVHVVNVPTGGLLSLV